MIKLEDAERIDLERDLDEAKIEEALAKWDAAKPLVTPENEEAIE